MESEQEETRETTFNEDELSLGLLLALESGAITEEAVVRARDVQDTEVKLLLYRDPAAWM